MKKLTVLTKTSLIFIIMLVSLTYCKNDEANINPSVSDSVVLSTLAYDMPNIDGNIDKIWDSAPKMTTVTEVPEPGNFLFPSYIGKKYNVTMRSLYDNTYIYFLVEWDDPDYSVKDRTWYFNPVTKLWRQESGLPVFNENGVKVRDAFNEDKLGVLWNINNSTPAFKNQTCFASCHLHDATSTTAKATGGNHYTNGINQRIDMWHLHVMRDAPFNMLSDEYQDYGNGAINANGRHTDTQIGTDGATNNRQTLTILDTKTSVTLPRWFIPNATGYYYILAKDTLPGGLAKLITAVDSTGVLYYGTSKVDPKTDIEFQQQGADIGTKCIPAFIISPMTGNRADINAKVVHNGRGYTLEIKRKLKTDDVLNQDVDFSSLDDQPFGIGVFNRADIAHAIKTNLVLSFKK